MVMVPQRTPRLDRERMLLRALRFEVSAPRPEVTLGILDGLVEDSERTAPALRRGLGFEKNFESKCDIKEGAPFGSSTCVDAKDSVCYTLSSGSGCRGPSGHFHFVWDAGAPAG